MELKDNPGCLSPGGRSYQSRGPAAEKLILSSSLCVCGTSSFCMLLELDRNGRRSVSERRQQSSARYMGAVPTRNWCTIAAILNTTRWRTGVWCLWFVESCSAVCTETVRWSVIRRRTSPKATASCVSFTKRHVYLFDFFLSINQLCSTLRCYVWHYVSLTKQYNVVLPQVMFFSWESNCRPGGN